mmetsp:Transcript_59480/g.126444  ORF Transcript_59480/g.126444 Transcript_59480/m.126444 type:complete len:219 (-) Transcript_59480:974-1630(-)
MTSATAVRWEDWVWDGSTIASYLLFDDAPGPTTIPSGEAVSAAMSPCLAIVSSHSDTIPSKLPGMPYTPPHLANFPAVRMASSLTWASGLDSATNSAACKSARCPRPSGPSSGRAMPPSPPPPNGRGYASSRGPTAVSHDLPCSIANTIGSLPVRSSSTEAAAGCSASTSQTMVCCRNGSRAMFAEMDALDPDREMKPRSVPPLSLLRRCRIDCLDCE